MQIQQLEKKATIAWSPLPGHGQLLAVGTIDGYVDQSFNTSSHLEIYEYNPRQQGELRRLGGAASTEGFVKVAWGRHSSLPFGVIVGAHSHGEISVWDPQLLLQGHPKSCLGVIKRHNRRVQALSFNELQPNILATASEDGALFIWDLKDPEKPTAYPPGTTEVIEPNLTALQWNHKRAHILASISLNGHLNVWDLKQKRVVVNLSVDPNNDARCRSLAWHPNEITVIAVGGDYNKEPMVQIWDLTKTFAPQLTLRGHSSHVVSISWSTIAPDLLLSTSQDCRTILWSASTGAPIQSVQQSVPNSWNSDVQWSNVLPATFTTTSIIGKITVSTVHDYRSRDMPGDFPPAPWLTKGPVRAAFGFGGKLVSFSRGTAGTTPSGAVVRVLETDAILTQQARLLDEAIRNGTLPSFCAQRIAALTAEGKAAEAEIWSFLSFSLAEDPRRTILNYLGLEKDQTIALLQQWLATLPPLPSSSSSSSSSTSSSSSSSIASPSLNSPLPLSSETAGIHNEDFGEAGAQQGGEGEIGADSLFADSGEGLQTPNLFLRDSSTPNPFLASPNTPSPFETANVNGQQPSTAFALSSDSFDIAFDGDNIEGNLTRALLVGDLHTAISACERLGRIGDALAIASCGGPELLKQTLNAYLQRVHHESPLLRLVSCITEEKLSHIASFVDLASWKQALAFFLYHAPQHELRDLASTLATRLEQQQHHNAALLCLIAVGDIDAVLRMWLKDVSSSSSSPPQSQQSLLEKLWVLKTGIQRQPGYQGIVYSQLLVNLIASQAELLVSEGSIVEAMELLSFVRENPEAYGNTSAGQLLSRIYNSLPPEVPQQQQQHQQQVHQHEQQQHLQQVHQHEQYPFSQQHSQFGQQPQAEPVRSAEPYPATAGAISFGPSPISFAPEPASAPIVAAVQPVAAAPASFGLQTQPMSFNATGIERPQVGAATYFTPRPDEYTATSSGAPAPAPPMFLGTGIERPRLVSFAADAATATPVQPQPVPEPPKIVPPVEPSPVALHCVKLQTEALAYVMQITASYPPRSKLATAASSKLEALASELKKNAIPPAAMTLLEQIYNDLLTNNHQWASYRYTELAEKYWDAIGPESAGALKRLIQAIAP